MIFNLILDALALGLVIWMSVTFYNGLITKSKLSNFAETSWERTVLYFSYGSIGLLGAITVFDIANLIGWVRL